MQAPIDICYAGVVVARAEEVRESEGGDLFIVVKDPLPVGTLVGVRAQDTQFTVRVARVVESVDGSGNGMQVRRLGADDPGAALWIPPPSVQLAPSPAVAPVSVAAKPPAIVERAPVAAEPPAIAGQAPVVAEPPAISEPAPAAARPPAAGDFAREETAPATPAATEPAAEIVAVASFEPTAPYGGQAPVAGEQDVPEYLEVFLRGGPPRDQAADPSPVGRREEPAVARTTQARSSAPTVSAEFDVVPVPAAAQSQGAPAPTAQGDSNGTPEKQAPAESASGAVEAPAESSGPTQTTLPLEGDLPPARPVQGASGRRRTKRRR